MSKSTFRLLILILAVVAILGVFTSLGVLNNDKGSGGECTHDFDYTNRIITQAGNCEVDEIGKVKCTKCNIEKDYLMKATGSHKYATEKITYRNVSSDVHQIVTSRTCSVCNHVDEYVAEKAHVLEYPLSFPFKFATCGEEGNVAFECSECHYAVTKTLPKLPIHTYHDGYCTVCGAANPDYDGTPNTCTHPNKMSGYGDTVSGNADYCAVGYDWYCFDCNEFGGLTMYCNNCQIGSCKYCDCH